MRERTRQKKARKITRRFCGIDKSSKKGLFALDFFFARDSFAGLVTYRAAGFASGLASASAFTTTGHFLICGFRNRLNHSVLLSIVGFSMTLL